MTKLAASTTANVLSLIIRDIVNGMLMPWIRAPPSELGAISASKIEVRRHSSDLVVATG